MLFVMVWCWYVFCVKPESSFEVRISDLSSDVCSSDLLPDLVCTDEHGARTAVGRDGAAAGADRRIDDVRAGVRRLRALRKPGPVAGVPRAAGTVGGGGDGCRRSEEHTSELQSLMRISYAVFCLKKKTTEMNQGVEQKNSRT